MPLERKPLFRPDILRPRLQSFELPQRVIEQRDLLTRWADLLASPAGDRIKEQEQLGQFLSAVFVKLLGYTCRPRPKIQKR